MTKEYAGGGIGWQNGKVLWKRDEWVLWLPWAHQMGEERLKMGMRKHRAIHSGVEKCPLSEVQTSKDRGGGQDQEGDGHRRKEGLYQALTNKDWRWLWLYDSWNIHLGWLRLAWLQLSRSCVGARCWMQENRSQGRENGFGWHVKLGLGRKVHPKGLGRAC